MPFLINRQRHRRNKKLLIGWHKEVTISSDNPWMQHSPFDQASTCLEHEPASAVFFPRSGCLSDTSGSDIRIVLQEAPTVTYLSPQQESSVWLVGKCSFHNLRCDVELLMPTVKLRTASRVIDFCDNDVLRLVSYPLRNGFDSLPDRMLIFQTLRCLLGKT